MTFLANKLFKECATKKHSAALNRDEYLEHTTDFALEAGLQTLELAHHMEHSSEKLAAITNAPVSAVKARIFHAHAKLHHYPPALYLMTTERWIQFRACELPPNYHTVRSSEARAPEKVIRAVSSPTIPLVELRAILDDAQLRIISGPTEAGLYSLATDSRRPVSSCLAPLHGHAAVRFANSTQPNVLSSDSAGLRPVSMRRWAPAILIVALTCACSNTPVRIESRALANLPTQSSDRFIIAAVDNDPAALLARAGSTPRGYDFLIAYGSTSHARQVMRSLEHDYGLREVSTWPIEPLHMHCAVLQIRNGTDRETLLAKLSRDPRIKLAQSLQTFATRSEGYNDPYVRPAHETEMYVP
jgi:hypothetical protein